MKIGNWRPKFNANFTGEHVRFTAKQLETLHIISTCVHCKSVIDDDCDLGLICSSDDSDCIRVNPSFGCIHWEPKE